MLRVIIAGWLLSAAVAYRLRPRQDKDNEGARPAWRAMLTALALGPAICLAMAVLSLVVRVFYRMVEGQRIARPPLAPPLPPAHLEMEMDVRPLLRPEVNATV
jgi:hypothetical protein